MRPAQVNRAEGDRAAQAVAETLRDMGSSILRNPHAFVANLMDLIPPTDRIGTVLVNNCDSEFLDPFVRALQKATLESLASAAATGGAFLDDARSLRSDVAHLAAWAMAQGIADFLGVGAIERPSVAVAPPADANSAAGVPVRRVAAHAASAQGASHMARTTRPGTLRARGATQSAHDPAASATYGLSAGAGVSAPSTVSAPTSAPASSPAQYPPYDPQQGQSSSGHSGVFLVLIAVLAALVVVGAMVLVDPFGTFGSGGTTDSSAAVTTTTGTAEGSDPSAPVVRDGLASYSWAELGELASYMEQTCSSRSEALSVAERYNLVGSGHTMPETTKQVELTDGMTLACKLIDVWHDEARTSSGYAALTFMSTNAPYTYRVSDERTVPGGWQSSLMRSYLNGEVYEKLPDELKSSVVEVAKYTNNEGYTRSQTCVTSTYDKLWLPSIVELSGPIDWNYTTDNGRNDAYFNAVFNAEGTQYAYFSQVGIVSEYVKNPSLAIGGQRWWLRSVSPSTGRARHVEADGRPDGVDNSNLSLGVVPCFCL